METEEIFKAWKNTQIPKTNFFLKENILFDSHLVPNNTFITFHFTYNSKTKDKIHIRHEHPSFYFNFFLW